MICSNPDYPCAEFILRRISVKIFIDFNKYFLRKVAYFILIISHAKDYGIYQIFITADKFAKIFLVFAKAFLD